MIPVHHRRHRFSDEDFVSFKKEVKTMRNDYNSGNEEEKDQIKNKFKEAIQKCQAHICGLKYSAGHDVSRTFATFYTPRLRLLQKTFSSLQ